GPGRDRRSRRWRAPVGSMVAQRVDEILLAHPRAAFDADILRLVVELFLAPVLVLAGLAAAPPGFLAGRVGDARRLLLAHAFAAQRFVALVVLHTGAVLL